MDTTASNSPIRGLGSLFIEETPSTNIFLWEMLHREQLPEGFVVYADYQTAGKGQTGNSWEAERGKNLLFSMVLYPQQIPLDELFLISQIVSLAIKKVLEKYTNDIEVKWPNDIYWKDKKLAGILIENSFQAKKVKTVIGIGLNVNQKTFTSNAPNPVSLRQITGRSLNRNQLLNTICKNILELYQELNAETIRSEYAGIMYRRNGFQPYITDSESFNAKIIAVHPDGKLELETESGERKGFYFKEVQFSLS
ncbi:MAG: biotin--[acetyl-CoA-carboxylase] ligase [Paludibacter sp.]